MYGELRKTGGGDLSRELYRYYPGGTEQSHENAVTMTIAPNEIRTI